ncbi:hypothetical protein DFJ77DRAFT_479062 [Powellomyces hirtus]|nr:hypothetical protein DFJ77DRAFT_479062 [Powellomyces hirtus]
MAATASTWQSNPLNAHTPAPASRSATELSRPEPCSASAVPFQLPKQVRHTAAGVSLDLQLDRTFFIARSHVSGRLALTVARNRAVKIGRISVDVIGFEETAGSALNRKTFLHHTLYIQDASQNTVPSDAVMAGPPDEHGMWLARKGRHVLDFAMPLENAGNGNTHFPGFKVNVDGPKPLPSSFSEKKVGGIRYVVCCTLQLKNMSHTHPLPPLSTFTHFTLLESAAPPSSAPVESLLRFAPTLEAGSPLHAETTSVVNGKYWFGKKGEVKLQATARVAGCGTAADGVWTAGTFGLVSVEVENGCGRNVETLTLSLIRRVKTFAQSASTLPLHTSSTTLSPGPTSSSLLLPLTFAREVVTKRTWHIESLKGAETLSPAMLSAPKAAWKGVVKGEKRALVAHLDVPIEARSIRYGMLLDVSYVVQVSVKPRRSRAIQVEIPVTILHPASLYTNLPPTCNIVTVHHPPTVVSSSIPQAKGAVPPNDVHNGRLEYIAPIIAESVTTDDSDKLALAAEGSSSSMRNASVLTLNTAGSALNTTLPRMRTQPSVQTLEALRTVSVTGPTGSAAVSQAGSVSARYSGSHIPHRRATLRDTLYSPPAEIHVPPENPPSPAAKRAASTSSNASTQSQRSASDWSPRSDEHETTMMAADDHQHQQPPQLPATMETEQRDSLYDASQMDDISKTIDKLFEGFPGCEAR